jgi:hypothetical protein
MGGNAFKELDGKILRLTKEEFNVFVDRILQKFHDYEIGDIACIASYRNKQSYGDCDLLYHQNIDLKILLDILGNPRYIINGDVISFAIPIADNYFQLDLIKVKLEEYIFAYNYFSYNDLGNFIGRIFHRMKFKFGHKGLYYVLRDKNNEDRFIKEILISLDWDKVLIFGGYDPNRWYQGFNTLEDVFKYAVSSEYASKQIFDLNEVSHKARIRDRKRVNYSQLLSWMNDPKNNVRLLEITNKEELSKIMLDKCFNLFPDFFDRYNQEMIDYEKRRIIKEKFNGIIVGEITGFKGKELGRFMEKYKYSIVNFEQFVLRTSEEVLKKSIIYFRENYYDV